MSDGEIIRRLADLERRLREPQGERSIAGAGSAFPSSPPTGLLWFRTDLGWLCYYDGTRWLTAHEYAAAFQTGTAAGTLLLDTAASNAFLAISRLRTSHAPYFTRCAVTTRVLTTNNGSNYWTFSIDAYTQTFGAGTTVYQVATSADTAGVYTDHEGGAATPAPSNRVHLVISTQITAGAPGVLRIIPTVYYRLIVT